MMKIQLFKPIHSVVVQFNSKSTNKNKLMTRVRLNNLEYTTLA